MFLLSFIYTLYFASEHIRGNVYRVWNRALVQTTLWFQCPKFSERLQILVFQYTQITPVLIFRTPTPCFVSLYLVFCTLRNKFFSSRDLNLRKKLVKCYIWSMALYRAETWTLRAADQKYLESFEMWRWRRMEKINWTDHVRNEEVLLRFNEQRNILYEIRKRKANWICHILRRNCLLKQVIEGKINGEMEVTRRRGRRRKKLLDDLKDRRGYCHLQEGALERTMWKNRFRGAFGPVVRQNIEWMNDIC